MCVGPVLGPGLLISPPARLAGLAQCAHIPTYSDTTTTNGHIDTQCYTSLIITINNINYVTGNINYFTSMTVWYITIEDTIWSL